MPLQRELLSWQEELMQRQTLLEGKRMPWHGMTEKIEIVAVGPSSKAHASRSGSLNKATKAFREIWFQEPQMFLTEQWKKRLPRILIRQWFSTVPLISGIIIPNMTQPILCTSTVLQEEPQMVNRFLIFQDECWMILVPFSTTNGQILGARSALTGWRLKNKRRKHVFPYKQTCGC